LAAERADAISWQSVGLGSGQELLPLSVARPQSVDQLLLAARHDGKRLVVAGGQQLSLFRQQVQERTLHPGQVGQECGNVAFPGVIHHVALKRVVPSVSTSIIVAEVV
jgi:hypothetical protein